jgi:hypothetical protein
VSSQPSVNLLAERLTLTRADHQTHRRFSFEVPEAAAGLELHVRYAPKFVSVEDSQRLVRTAVASQVEALTSRVGAAVARGWASDYDHAELRVPNLVTLSLDDARGTYRGASHRHAEDQRLTLGGAFASPGLVAGAVPAGLWVLTLTAHTLVSDQCEVEIQIGAVIASSSA